MTLIFYVTPLSQRFVGALTRLQGVPTAARASLCAAVM